MISSKLDYLIVLYLTRKGDLYEVYNGRGKLPWETASKKDSHKYRHMRVNRLMKLDKEVRDEDRIKQIHPLEKMQKEYKNKK